MTWMRFWTSLPKTARIRARRLHDRYRRWHGSGHYVFSLLLASFVMLVVITLVAVGFLVLIHTNVSDALTRPISLESSIEHVETRLAAERNPAERTRLQADLATMYLLRDHKLARLERERVARQNFEVLAAKIMWHRADLAGDAEGKLAAHRRAEAARAAGATIASTIRLDQAIQMIERMNGKGGVHDAELCELRIAALEVAGNLFWKGVAPRG